MKRILLLVLAFTAAIGSLSAQNYIVVNSEKVFKSIDEYNKALDTLDQLAKSYQQQVDLKFEEVEALYNNYKAQEMSLMKKRIELIQPIQKRVFDAIANYAAQNGYELVLDAASNPTLLYNSEKIDHTQALIEFMKK